MVLSLIFALLCSQMKNMIYCKYKDMFCSKSPPPKKKTKKKKTTKQKTN